MISEKEIKKWYDSRHISFEENVWRSFEAYSTFLDHLNIKAGGKLLDIGCRRGYLLKASAQRGLQTCDIDISEEGVKIAKRISPNPKIIVGKGENLKFPDNFF